ncbi:ATP-binding cassette domain-containing protein [Glutamicibacter sp. MNS18]|uniref:peptidase domain-containing ABC transporter n=1 Tax=Glutamicibacter sp. MNS18 TaxID=2989817 RepID=UPI002235BFDA|nr:ATP-binding cassette domain-containing protein [Glutamicibacter sp. MNS18]MCW4465256.1 ATP-binding cassette domain-containing protein [Glutamicibacter sp. MNS18]
MARTPVILQTAETDCAPACLASLLRFHGRQVSLSGVRQEMDPGRDGSSGLVIRDTAATWGIKLKAFLADPRELVENLGQLPLPAMVHFSRQHYVLVEKVQSRHLVIMDPAIGRRKIGPEQLIAECSGMVMVVSETDTIPPEQYPPSSAQHPYRLLAGIITSVRGNLGHAALLSGLLAVFGLALPLATALIVDAMVASELEQQRWLLFGIGLALAMGLLTLARNWVLSTLQFRLAGSLSHRVAGTLYSRSLRFFDRRSVGDLVGRVESAHAIHALLSITLLGAALDGILTLGYVMALLVIAPSLALTTTLVIGTALGTSWWVATRCAALRREEILVHADSSTLLVDGITGMGTLRAYGSEQPSLHGWQQLLTRRLTLTRSRTRLNAVSLALLAALAIATPLAILLQASTITGNGFFSAITPGTALGLMGLAAATLTPVVSLATQLITAADLRPLLDRVEDLETAPAERTGGQNPGELSGAIRLESVGFRHDRHGRNVLTGISGSVPAGSKLCILGPTGCGKTTLAQLLAGLHDPTAGRILIDGQDLQQLDPQLVRPHIGVVFQENWLARGTIRDAVVAGREGYEDQQVWQALAKAQLAPEIAALPLGIDTRLGSTGSGLSGGQRQRLALARALLANPRILILDEPTSALDGGTERRIEQVLRELSITRIIITHRLDVAADADQIWVMDEGRITEQGSPADLSEGTGWYAGLVRQRMGAGSTTD